MTGDTPDLLAALQASVDRARAARDPFYVDTDAEPPNPPPASSAPSPPPTARRRRATSSTRAERVRRVECPAAPAYGPSGCGAPAGEKCRNADGTPRDANHQARVKAHKRKYPTHESQFIGRPAAQDYYGRDHEGVSGAIYDGDCPRCGESLTLGQGTPVKTSRGYVHPLCAPGADDT